ncbi:cold-shock protein [Nocardioides sp. Soil805]|nr:cold-shock protein [Nocardioides sp. Soil805]
MQGVVREWHDDEGWGVIDSEATPGGCWAHFSSVLVAGQLTLRVGQPVTFTFEVVDQDGFSHRSVEVWPTGAAPVRTEPSEWDSTAFRSELRITFDDA